jgi:peptide/nickel transport system ATP-binding protein
MIYQPPYEALSPRLSVAESIGEPLRRHRILPRERIPGRVADLMAEVDLAPDLARRRPHELSGGQCQRVATARALALEPSILIADEVTSALDVTLQAQVLGLLRRLQEDRGLTMIFICHDLGVIRRLCDHVVVMRAGQIVAAGPVEQALDAPAEEYTRNINAAIPHFPGPAADHAAAHAEPAP